MKTLLIVLLALGSLSAFAGRFDRMSIKDIYQSGYVLKATVYKQRGIVIKVKKEKVSLYLHCDVYMKRKSISRRILRRGRQIITSSQEGSSWLYLYSRRDRSVKKIGLYGYNNSSTLSQINKACKSRIIFTVVPDRTVKEAQMPREMPTNV